MQVTFISLDLPKSTVVNLLPQNLTLLGDGSTHSVVFELGREINTGPPLAQGTFQEAKLEIPNVKRLKNSDAPFVYKKSIWVDQEIQAFGSGLVYGLNGSKQTFTPADTSNAPNYNYAIDGILQSDLNSASTKGDVAPYQAVASQPWFGSGLLCAQHRYNLDAPVQEPIFLQGSLTLDDASGLGGTYQVQAMHATYTFEILAPQLCLLFA